MPIFTSGSFKAENDARRRQIEATRIRTKYPDRVPIIVEQRASTDFPACDNMKRKFLVPGDLTMGQFMYVIRKRLLVAPEVSIFLFVGGTVQPSAALLGAVYDQHQDDDGFLYVVYSGENTFG